ncbi:MAG: TraB/GumN family protein [Saprospiraceae bacterium]|nr:MAG: TraB/GumN family protein [Saprospiraceae bacterium]
MKYLLLLFMAQSLSINLPAQQAEQPGFLYGIMSSLDSGAHISFLFGTLHHLDGNYLLKEHPTVLQLATGAELMAGEAAPGDAKECHGTDWSKKNTGKSLRDLLTRADFRYVGEEFRKATGQSIEGYLYYYPSVLRSMIKWARSTSCPPEEIEYRIVPDLLFAHVAKSKGIPQVGLETVEQSIAAQLSVPLKDQAFLLVEGLDDAKIDSIIAGMNACYMAQDLDCFCKIMDMENYSYPGDEQMLKGRNLLWMEKLPAILREKRAFIYVGSGHLCGEYGLLALLRKEGFFIVPMRYP